MTERTFTNAEIRRITTDLRTDNGANLDACATEAAWVLDYLYREVNNRRATTAAVGAVRDDLRRHLAPEPASSDRERGRWEMAGEISERLDEALYGGAW